MWQQHIHSPRHRKAITTSNYRSEPPLHAQLLSPLQGHAPLWHPVDVPACLLHPSCLCGIVLLCFLSFTCMWGMACSMTPSVHAIVFPQPCMCTLRHCLSLVAAFYLPAKCELWALQNMCCLRRRQLRRS